MHKYAISNKARIATNFEYDLFLHGQNNTDGNFNKNAVVNQGYGYGLRGSVMLEMKKVSFGPFIQYWNIVQSSLDKGLVEPNNNTFEAGVQAFYRI